MGKKYCWPIYLTFFKKLWWKLYCLPLPCYKIILARNDRYKWLQLLPDKTQWNAIFHYVLFSQASTFLPCVRWCHVDMKFSKLKKNKEKSICIVFLASDYHQDIALNWFALRTNRYGRFDLRVLFQGFNSFFHCY